MTKVRTLGIAAVAVAGAAAAAVGFAATMSSCAATPTNIPVRSFQQARNVDYLCIAFNDPRTDLPLSPTQTVGLPSDLCTQVPIGIVGSTLDNHLIALVTQATRGEVAVVDLTAGGIVDESHETPGVNFIPVGAVPTGIVVAPDAQMTFVSSADTNKPAIYGIPTNARQVPGPGGTPRWIAGVLGDSTQTATPGPGGGIPSPLQLTDLPACALPQPPQSISVVPLPPAQGGPPAGYVLAVVLQRSGSAPARVVTIDPTGLARGVGLDVADAGGDAGSPAEAGATGAAAVTPGVLAGCPILGATALANVGNQPSPVTWTPGPTWPDGVPYADVGDLSAEEPAAAPGCFAPEAGASTLTVDPFAQPYPAHAVLRDDAPILYVGDAELPVIHVLDLSNPVVPTELAPLLATSIAQPARRVAVGDLAISPVTRQYQRYLYAVDSADGSVMVFDVTDPMTSPRTPMQRPHPELNPLAPPDRLSFGSPVATVAFATHDWPIIPPGPSGQPNVDQVHALSGLLCNPNPNAVIDAGANAVRDNGYFYTAQEFTVPFASGTQQTIPERLRGVFGFVTLASGQVVTIDVDDWDAPCRRPDIMAFGAGPDFGRTGLLDIPEPDAGPPGSATYLDPYSVPTPEPPDQPSSVTQEAFFPVSAPHRMRSSQLLRIDLTAGANAPNLVAPPALTDVSGTSIATSAAGMPPMLLPTSLPDGFTDPSLAVNPTDLRTNQRFTDASTEPGAEGLTPGVRLSFDDPTASQNQSWAVTYEGMIPTLANVAADIVAPGDSTLAYETLTFTIGQEIPGPTGAPEAGFPVPGLGPGFCERGIEDWDVGQARAQRALDAMAASALPAPPDLKNWTSDYVEILDDPLPQGDAYWNVPNSCWEGLTAGDVDLSPSTKGSAATDPQSKADARYNACMQTFGAGSTADEHLARDLPILRAYDDHLDVGRFYWPSSVGEQTTNRTIVGQDPTNRPSLRFVSCCFHNQATFKVRAGGEWVAAGQNGLGFLHHVVAGPAEKDPLSGTEGRPCVLSCDPHQVLLNSRSFDVPWTPIPWFTSAGSKDAGAGEVADARADGSSDAGAGAAGGALACTAPKGLVVPRTSPLAMQNPFFSYVTWMGCALPASPFDHTITPRDDAWRFQVGGGFAPLTVSLTSNSIVDISPQSMRYIQPLGWLAVVDGQSQGLELIDLNAVAVTRTYY